MKKFYIFLDIDGVMYDWDYIIAEVDAGRLERGTFKFKPESINALNFLIEQLQQKFDVGLVISSTWRSRLQHTVQFLKDNGLIFDKTIERTPLTHDPAHRAEQILGYLNDKQNYNFVIIDDEMFNFEKFFYKQKIIKCEMFHSALNMQMVKNYLSNTSELKKTYNSTKSFEQNPQNKFEL